MSAVGLIPARMQSSRLPGKPLAMIQGLPMIVHVFKRAQLATSLDDVYVVTDSTEIEDIVKFHGGKVIRSRMEHENGTTRIAEAVDWLGNNHSIYIDIQGDEPLVDPINIDRVANYHSYHKMFYEIVIPTIDIHLQSEADNVNVVKVVVGTRGNVVYLTRARAPYDFRGSVVWKKHLSVIGFTREALRMYTQLPPSNLEQIEGVELLRALDHGMMIGTVSLSGDSFSVDVPADLERANLVMAKDTLFTTGRY